MKKPLIILWVAVAAAVLVFAPHGTRAQPAPGGDEFDVLHGVTTGPDGKPGPVTTQRIPKQHAGQGASPPVPKPAGPAPAALQPTRKLHPTLEQWVTEAERGAAGRTPQDRVEVLVTLPDDAKLTKLPELPNGETGETAAATPAGRQRQQRIEGLRAQREQAQDPTVRKFEKAYGLTLKEQYWLVNGFLAEVPLSALRALAADPAVASVQPRALGERLPVGNGNSKDDPAAARKRMASDAWRTLPYATQGRIGLLDSGVRTDHVLLSTPSHLGVVRDCTGTSTKDCGQGTIYNCYESADYGWVCDPMPDPAYNPYDCIANGGHGTASAAILTGNSNLGDAYQGVTAATVDSWKISPGCQDSVDYPAVVKAFQKAVSFGDKVIVAEIQASDVYATIEAAADNAFDLGAVVVAANGNFGPNPGTVTSPARAHKVLGVGAYQVQDGTTIDDNPSGEGIQSRGPTTDGRVKPDLQGPTCTETASNASTTALWSAMGFCGTSGSTPYAGGAAALVRNDFAGSYNATDPGWTYAALLAAAEHDTVVTFGTRADYDNQFGAGQLKLPPACRTWYYYGTSIANGQWVDLPLYFGGGSIGVKAAIWWPEKASETHDDLDLYLIDPAGNTVASSITVDSVFEKIQTLGTVTPGTWKLSIHGFKVQSGPQPVYAYAYVPC